MAVPHGPAGVRSARHRMRDELHEHGLTDTVIDDAVLILSELLSNACRHGRPLPASAARPPGREAGHRAAVGGDGHTEGREGADADGDVLAAWEVGPRGRLTVEVTDGGGPTRPMPSKPSVTARGGRGLSIITALSENWGVRDEAHGVVTVWAVLGPGHRAEDFASRITAPRLPLADLEGLGFPEPCEVFDGIE